MDLSTNNKTPGLLREDLSWCLQRLPLAWRKLMEDRPNKVFLAGGFIRSCIANEPINDADFFCPTADTAAACALSLSEGGKHRVVLTDNAHTVVLRPFTAQFIHRWTFDKPETCIESFDFTIAKAAIWFNGVEWTSCVHERFYADMASKRLIYCAPVRNEDAGGSLLRVLKFYQRGYRIPLDSMGSAIARLVMAVDFSKIEKAEDREAQLAKVLTGLLREVDPNIDPTHQAHLSITPRG